MLRGALKVKGLVILSSDCQDIWNTLCISCMTIVWIETLQWKGSREDWGGTVPWRRCSEFPFRPFRCKWTHSILLLQLLSLTQWSQKLGCWRDFGSKERDRGKGKMCVLMVSGSVSILASQLSGQHCPGLVSAHLSSAFKEKSKNQTRNQYIHCSLDCVVAQRDSDKKRVLEIRKWSLPWGGGRP